MCNGRITKSLFVAFRDPALDDAFTFPFHSSPGFRPSNSFVSLRELGPADELLIQPTILKGEPDWAITTSARAITHPILDGDGTLVSPADPYVMGLAIGPNTGALRVPLEGLDTRDLWFWSGKFGVVTAFLISAVQAEAGAPTSISAEPVGAASGNTQRGCG